MSKQQKHDGQDMPQGHAKGKPSAPVEPTQDVADVAGPVQNGTAELGQRIAELTEALQRERADAINVRRRADEQIAGMSSTVKASVVRQLLPVIDNFERALKHVPAELAGSDFAKGVQGIAKQFEKTLGDIGVVRIKTVGEVFDPHMHEAVSVEETGDGQEIVSEELQAGYLLANEVIRPAMVRVRG